MAEVAGDDPLPISWWQDRRNQFSLKLAVAGCLALYLTQVLALSQSVWALVTVMMLMIPVYVGAVAEKSVFRAIGTVVGGFLAVFLVGNLLENPVVFLLLLGLVVMVCVFFNGGTRAPYAFFLTALTMVVIVSRTTQDPSAVWEIALYRVEEILLGIFCSLVVTAIFWPRYARDDFALQAREAMKELVRVERKLRGPNAMRIGDQPEVSLLGLSQKMRNLIQLGGRESSYFRANSEIMQRIVNATSSLNQAILEFASIPENNPDLVLPAELLTEFIDSWEVVMRELAETTPQVTVSSMETLRASAAALEKLLEERRAQLQAGTKALDEILALSMLALLVADIIHQTGQLAEYLPLLPRDRGTFPQFPKKKKTVAFAGSVDFFWVKNGVRTALAVGSALVFCDWINPPGASLIPVFALIFPMLSRTYPTSRGDLGVFTTLVQAAVLGIPWALFVFLISPWLTNYLWMNLFLGLCFFGLGRLIYPRLPALTLTGLVVINGLVSTFALNFQEPVTFYDVSSNYLGFILGLLFAAVFQRLLWPTLPQREFLHASRQCLGVIAALLTDPEPGKRATEARSKILQQISELRKWSSSIPRPFWSREEEARREEMIFLLRRLARVSLRVAEIDSGLPSWPGVGHPLELWVENLRAEAAAGCRKLQGSLQSGKVAPLRSLSTEKRPQFEELTKQVFLGARPENFSNKDWSGWMGLLLRHMILAERLDDLAAKLDEMDLAKLKTDPVL